MKMFNVTYNAKLDDGDTFTEDYINVEEENMAALMAECHRRAVIKSYIVSYEIKVAINFRRAA
mgnify:FL=1